MQDPYKQLTSILDMRMCGIAKSEISGVPCELGIITSTGLKLDNFKHEIKDYLIADWNVKVHFPSFTMLGTWTAPVDENGIPEPDAKSYFAKNSFQSCEVDKVRLELAVELNPGDRVLAIPVNGGQDFVIMSKVIANA